MIDKQSLQDYRPATPGVESVDGDRLRLFCGDDLPGIGTAVGIVDDAGEPLYAVVERHSGARRVDAWLPLAPDWIRPDLAIEITNQPAGFARPGAEVLIPSPTLLRPAGDGDVLLWPAAPEWSELETERPPLSTGVAALDSLAPLCEGGLNLVIDNSNDPMAFYRLAARAENTIEPAETLLTSSQPLDDTAFASTTDLLHIRPGDSLRSQVASLQFVIALAADLRQTNSSLAVVDLPTLESRSQTESLPDADLATTGLADIIDRLGRHLVSTNDATLTTVLRLRMPTNFPGLATIIETLNLGDVDATVHIDDQGRFDPRRSTSDADLDDDAQHRRRHYLDLLQRADQAREKTAIFGDQELTDAQRDALDEVDELWAPIV